MSWEEVWTGRGLLIKHYSTVINILPPHLNSTQVGLTNTPNSSSSMHVLLLPFHYVSLTWIIMLSSFPQTLATLQKHSHWLACHTLSLAQLGLDSLRQPILFRSEQRCNSYIDYILWVIMKKHSLADLGRLFSLNDIISLYGIIFYTIRHEL